MMTFLAFLKAALRDYAGMIIAGIVIGVLARGIWPPEIGTDSSRQFSEPLPAVSGKDSENSAPEISQRPAAAERESVAK